MHHGQVVTNTQLAYFYEHSFKMFVAICVVLLEVVSAQTGQRLPNVVNNIGVGYNLLYGNPDGLHWKSGGEDPGLLLTRQIFTLGKTLCLLGLFSLTL